MSNSFSRQASLLIQGYITAHKLFKQQIDTSPHITFFPPLSHLLIMTLLLSKGALALFTVFAFASPTGRLTAAAATVDNKLRGGGGAEDGIRKLQDALFATCPGNLKEISISFESFKRMHPTKRWELSDECNGTKISSGLCSSHDEC